MQHAVRQPAVFIAHGAGPLPLLGAASQASLTSWLRSYASTLPERPQAILIVSAHWEEAQPTLNAGRAPPLLYDYSNFPPEAYRIEYPAPGSPGLAERAAALLRAAGFTPRMDSSRGYDHGVFVPLKLAFPAANIPVVQLSLLDSMSAQEHIDMGRALAPLRDEGVMIAASGMSYHNMRGFNQKEGGKPASQASQEFDAFLQDTIANPQHSQRDRLRMLRDWEGAPSARECHPREEHLLPLHVAAGAAGGEAGRLVHGDTMMGVKVSSFQWDA